MHMVNAPANWKAGRVFKGLHTEMGGRYQSMRC